MKQDLTLPIGWWTASPWLRRAPRPIRVDRGQLLIPRPPCPPKLWLGAALSRVASLNGERVESGLLSPQTGQSSAQPALKLKIWVPIHKRGSTSTLHSLMV